MKQKEYTPLLRGSSEKSKTHEPEQEAQTSGKQPMMYVDVFVEQDGEQVKQRIPVYEDDLRVGVKGLLIFGLGAASTRLVLEAERGSSSRFFGLLNLSVALLMRFSNSPCDKLSYCEC